VSDDPHANSTLYRFLDAARVSMEFWNAMSAAGIAATLVCGIALPFVAWRAAIGLRDGVLAVAIVICTGTLFAFLARRRSVRIQQVPQRLEVEVSDRDRVATATEFMGDEDPFKRLAVRQTEQWIDEEREKLSQIKKSRWPYVGVGAIVLLILIWALTTGWNMALGTRSRAVASNMTMPPDSASAAEGEGSLIQGKAGDKNHSTKNGSSKSGPLALGGKSLSGVAGGPGGGGSENTAAESARVMEQNGTGQGNLPSPSGGDGNATSTNAHPGTSGQVHGQVSTDLSGGAGRGSAAQTPTGKAPSLPTIAVHTTQARPGNNANGPEKEIEVKDAPPVEHAAAAPDVQFKLNLDSSELEELPPGRREIVVEYFRSMHHQAAPSTQSSEGAP
jgi:hypothetical protein